MREVAIATTARDQRPLRPEPAPEDRVAPSGLCTVREAAEALGVSERTVYRMIDAGEIPAARVRGALRIPRARLSDLFGA